mmetsp:Transcript_39685/g.69788  ORF Transcript_39685/g.69788 Transcript_39685/m.69788 type:complete len:95 (+) Transcript_39685:162-446(+)
MRRLPSAPVLVRRSARRVDACTLLLDPPHPPANSIALGGAEEAVAIICEHLSRAKHEEDSADELLSADGDEDATLCDEERMWDRPDFSHSSTVR